MSKFRALHKEKETLIAYRTCGRSGVAIAVGGQECEQETTKERVKRHGREGHRSVTLGLKGPPSGKKRKMEKRPGRGRSGL